MASREIEIRIEEIKKLIIVAHSEYQEYLKLGDRASINDYSRVYKSILEFYDSREQTESHPRYGTKDTSISMYGAMKNHKNLSSKMAISKMDKELWKEKGINTKELVDFEDPEFENMIARLDKFFKDCFDSMCRNFPDGWEWAGRDFVADYISSIKRLPKSELANVNIPDVEEFLVAVKLKIEKNVNNLTNEYKNYLLAFEEAFRQYKAKGYSATIGEFEKLQEDFDSSDKVVKQLVGFNPAGYEKGIKKRVIDELIQQGSLLADNLYFPGDKYGPEHVWDSIQWSTNERCAYKIISEFESVVKDKIKTTHDKELGKFLLDKLGEQLNNMKNQPMSSLLNMDEFTPINFVLSVKEKFYQKDSEQNSAQKGGQ